MRVAQEKRTDCQGTDLPELQVPNHGQDAVASRTRRRQIQLDVPSVQEKGAS